jgi:hypothetical protein
MREQRRSQSDARESAVRVVAFSREESALHQNRKHTWREWHSFRNQVLDILSTYGSVGPMGKMPILDSYEESENSWQCGNKTPDFFVVDDDIYGDSVRVEADCTLVKEMFLPELLLLLAQSQEWSVYLALVKGGLWVFHDRILFEGDLFAGCASVADLYYRCALADDSPGVNC